MALFGEKYGERVRTVTISGSGERYSYELCGGCHVKSTSEIGSFVFVNEGSVSAGIRRVEALTGHAAVNYVQQQVGTLNQISAQLSAQPEQISARLSALQDELSGARKQIAALQRELTRQHFQALLGSIETINGKQVLIAQISDVPLDMLREMSDWFRGAVRSGVMVLGSIIDGKPQLFVTVTDDLTKQGVHAGNLVKQIAAVVEGGGGGRPNMAQAGGRNAGKLPDALALARQLL